MPGGWDIYGQLIRAQAELLGADPTPELPGRVYFRTDQLKLKIDLGASVDTFAQLLAGQTFAGNNTFSGANTHSGANTFSGVNTFSLALTLTQIATPSNPAAGFNKLYTKSDDEVYYLTSGGSERRILNATTTNTAPTQQKFTATGTTTGYAFSITPGVVQPGVGATYTNNGNTYTVQAQPIAGATTLFCSQAAAPQASGTLTKTSGTGDATITFAAARITATYTRPTGPTPLYIEFKMVGGGAGGAAADTNVGLTGQPTFFGFSTAGAGNPGNTAGGAGGFGASSILYTNAIGHAGPGTPGGGGTTGATLTPGGYGGNSIFGGGGSPQGNTAGTAAVANSGSGGAGGSVTAGTTGGGGESGGWVIARISNPAATYPYAIGGGGAGGAAGSRAGGNGADGIIIVTEYYQ